MVNNLEVKKLHMVLMGLAGLAMLAALAVMPLDGVPVLEIKRYVPWVSLATAYSVVNTVLKGVELASLIAIFGGGIGFAIRTIGLAVLRRYARRYGRRAAALL